MNLRLLSGRTGVFCAALLALPAARAATPLPPGWQYDLKLGTGLFAEGARDLGLGDADDTTEGFADLQGTAYWNGGERWAALLRGQAFLPTDELTVTDEDQPRRSESYVRLREAWIESAATVCENRTAA